MIEWASAWLRAEGEMRSHGLRAAARLPVLLSIALVLGPSLRAEGAFTPGAVRAYATIHAIGIEWDIAADPQATVHVEYRAHGEAAWKRASPLVWVHSNEHNLLAGSILFLSPDTAYEVKLNPTNAVPGAETRIITVATRPVPAPPTGGRTLHVIPGAGGGDGSSRNPFKGITAAQALARPGDVFLVHGGNYGGRAAFDKSGTAGRYIVWKAAGPGEALFLGIDVSASYVWLDGLTIRDQFSGLVSKGGPTDVVVSRCHFSNNHYSIHLQQGGSHWYIADNTIVGDTPAWTESLSGEGIELNGGASESHGHVVAHNSITNVADGISNGDYNIDMFGNDIFDVSDDGIEGEPGRANIRMWGNRIHNAAHNGISFQPQLGGPWYIVRNQLVGFEESPFKFRSTDRSIIVHNTIVNRGKMTCCYDAHLLRSMVKNNLWISASGGQIWDFGSSVKDWRTDVDSNGFDWGESTAPFRYGGHTYSTLAAFAAASGLETSGLRIEKGGCFEAFNVPGPPLASVPPQYMSLKPACPAIDAGARLPNLNDAFLRAGPDVGAYEFGRPLPHYGPRPLEPVTPRVPQTNGRGK